VNKKIRKHVQLPVSTLRRSARLDRLPPALAAVGLFLASGAGAVANEASAIEAGRQIALAICAKCHVAAENQPAPALRPPAPSFNDIAAEPDVTEESLRVFLGRPHGEQRRMSIMPPFVLPASQVDAVVAYLLSLKRQ